MKKEMEKEMISGSAQEDRYEKVYHMVMDYEEHLHEKNQKRIRIGLKCIIIIPLIFLALLFWTQSNKVIFLILWIVSLFALAVYLIGVEYMDYNLMENVQKLKNDGDEVDMESYNLINNTVLENKLKEAEEKLDTDPVLNAIPNLKEKLENETIPAIKEKLGNETIPAIRGKLETETVSEVKEKSSVKEESKKKKGKNKSRKKEAGKHEEHL